MKIILFALNSRQVLQFTDHKPRNDIIVHTPQSPEFRLMGLVRDTSYYVMPGYPEADPGLRLARARYNGITSEAEFRSALQQMETNG